MKKLIFITIMLLSTLACAGACDNYNDDFPRSYPPKKSGTYTQISSTNTYSDGTVKTVGGGIMYDSWEDSFWYRAHNISCTITDIKIRTQYDDYNGYKSCYAYTIDCSVSERMQFYADGIVTYYDLQGYRNNGTLKWSRDKAGSTDIYCYDKSGLSVVKRVNDPQYCK